ncbi:MAG: ATP-binding cassette domain-containing protein [Archaeoglobus sp.]|jgi:ABC-type branched-subunit amino acid transport system ATPase component|nr:ATP-binding cassette domain-containing protein [Archaeoglobus sp.]
MLEVVEVSKMFGRNVVLKNVTFSLKNGILGIYGANGSGKTTLLKIISGFEKPSCGRVFFNGREITNKAPQEIVKLGVAMAFQIPRVFWNLTVHENVLLAARETDYTAEICKELNLEDALFKKAKEISQGKVKLLQLAMCFALKPKLALLDEPFASLDAENVEVVLEFLKKRGSEISMIITAHRTKILKTIASQMLEIRGGKIVGGS